MNYLLCTFQPLTLAENGGYAILPPGWIHPRRKIPTSVLILGRKGNVLIEEENNTLEIRPNRLTLLIANRLHQGKCKIESTASYYWLHFIHPNKPEILMDKDVSLIFNNPLVIKQRLAKAALIPQEFDFEQSDHISSLFHELLNEQENPSQIFWKFQMLFQNLMITITEYVIQTYKPSPTSSLHSSLVSSMLSYILAELTNPDLSVKSIAYQFHYNPDYIGRQFKNAMGVGIGKYILQQRIGVAVKYLHETYDSVNSIAQKSGFISLRHFLRQFKKEKGMTPSELRHRYHAMHINIH